MITYYKTADNKLETLPEFEQGCWINMLNPNEDEITYITDLLALERSFVSAALDEEETSRIESEDGNTLVIVDAPYARKGDEGVIYSTMPAGIILVDNAIVTVSLHENPILRDFADNIVKNVNTSLKTRFLLHILLRVATRFNQHLRQIDKLSSYIEKQLHASMKNKELIQLLELEKSLVYFSTSLKSNELTLEKILRGRFIKLYDEDQDILEDVLIEVKQAIEMSNIYASILSGTMDAFASIISNNLNIVMKVLTLITILMSIPTMISSFYGMNVDNLPIPTFWFPIALSVIVTTIVGVVLFKKKLW